MSVRIINTLFRGKKVAVLLKDSGNGFEVKDVNGYCPSNFPTSLITRAVKATGTKPAVPTVYEVVLQDEVF